jgi:hypothetical protein
VAPVSHTGAGSQLNNIAEMANINKTGAIFRVIFWVGHLAFFTMKNTRNPIKNSGLYNT